MTVPPPPSCSSSSSFFCFLPLPLPLSSSVPFLDKVGLLHDHRDVLQLGTFAKYVECCFLRYLNALDQCQPGERRLWQSKESQSQAVLCHTAARAQIELAQKGTVLAHTVQCVVCDLITTEPQSGDLFATFAHVLDRFVCHFLTRYEGQLSQVWARFRFKKIERKQINCEPHKSKPSYFR